MTPTVTRLLPGFMAMALIATGAGTAKAEMAPNWEESGQASWYGSRFEGRRTSSGRTFDPHELTAAHDTLPLGSRIRVTRQDTGRSVVVTVTDRMPPKRVRVIDLSRAAAKQIGLIASGVGPVTLTEAKPTDAEEVAEAPIDMVSPPRLGSRHSGRLPPERRAAAGPRSRH